MSRVRSAGHAPNWGLTRPAAVGTLCLFLRSINHRPSGITFSREQHMAAALNAFMQIDGAFGESRQGGYEKWIEIQSWEWEVEAETSWTKGGGASVGKPSPGKMSWEHYWDRSSPTLLGYICTGSA